MSVVGKPSQATSSAGSSIVEFGYTSMVNVCGVPGQPFKRGVTVIFAICVTAVVFNPIKDRILPLPLAGIPIEGLSFNQSKVSVGSEPENITSVVFVFTQIA